ncbi:MAG: hypothetical protein H0T84_11660 [Tatlockia sp.]|nr:hypothetical protein [Tatlockia sp.]
MKQKFTSFTRFFNTVKPGVQIKGCVYDEDTIAAIRKLKRQHNIQLIKSGSDEQVVYRGVSVGHFLGSLERPGLGTATMRVGIAKYMLEKGYNSLAELSSSEIESIINEHVDGFSAKKGNTKDKANSFTYCPSVALGFGIDAAKKTSFPLTTLIVETPAFDNLHHWKVTYDLPTEDGDPRGTSSYSYQHEALIAHAPLPLRNCVVIKRNLENYLHVNELANAKIYTSSLYEDAANQSLIQSPDLALSLHKYQELEIQKAIAFDDLIRYAFIESADDFKAMDLFQNYNNIRKEQARLINLPHNEKNRWIEVANEVAPNAYSVISCDENGFTIELPGQNSKDIVATISNIQASILFAPLFEMDPSLTLDQIKNGEIPEAINYMVESVIRSKQNLVDLSALKELVISEKAQNPTNSM